MLVHLGVAEVQAVRVDGDVDGTRLGRTVDDDGAFRLLELAAPVRQAAEVVGLEARVGVVRVDLVGVGGEGEWKDTSMVADEVVIKFRVAAGQ